jgi:RHS repeat-associated protein
MLVGCLNVRRIVASLVGVGLVGSAVFADGSGAWAQEPHDSVPVDSSVPAPDDSVPVDSSVPAPGDSVPVDSSVPAPEDSPEGDVPGSRVTSDAMDEVAETDPVGLPMTQVPLDGDGSVMADDVVLAEPVEWSAKGAAPVRLPKLAEGSGPSTADAELLVAPPDPVMVASRAPRTLRLGDDTTAVDSAASLTVAADDIDSALGAPDELVAGVVGSAYGATVGLQGGAVRLVPSGDGGPVVVEFDLAFVVGSSSADVVDRVRVVSLPECVLTTPSEAGCSVPTPVPFEVDHERGVVSAEVAAPGDADDGLVVGLSTVTGSSQGSYAATPLKASSMWAAGEQAGDFTWRYPVPLVPAWFGPVPSVDLTYSAQSLDGLSDVENNQGGLLGLGWDVGGGGFIERSYRSCNQDGTGWSITDLCWVSDNATISVAGHSSRLVPTGVGDEWRLEQDPNWIVKRVTGTAGSPDKDGERWEVRSPDGLLYTFGAVPASSSVWTVPVFGNNAGEPCYTGTSTSSWCMQAWRWNLDQVIDLSGNTMSFGYFAQSNNYGRHGTPAWSVSYTSGGFLSWIEYGARPAVSATSRVEFEVAKRCLSNNTAGTGCYWYDASRATQYWPDRPSDLVCTSTTYCPTTTPTFFIEHVLKSVKAQVRDAAGGAWRTVNQVATMLEWPDPAGPTEPQLWLREIQRSGFSSSGSLSLPAVRFEAMHSFLDNRADAIDLFYWRVDEIHDELGGVTDVTYQVPTACPVRSPSDPHWENNDWLCFPLHTTVGGNGGFGEFNRHVVSEVRQRDATMASTTPLVTSYQYLDGAAWHHDDNPVVPAGQRTYSDYRGFSRVRVIRGVPGDQLVTDKVFFRGMHGDVLPSGTRAVSVSTTSGGVTDDAWRRGLLAETRTIDNAGAMVTYDLSTFTPVTTATGGGLTATRVDPTKHNSGVRQGAGWRETETQITYTGDGFAQQVWERGDVTNASDDRCSYTSYLAATATLRGLPNGEQLFAGTCGGTFQAFTQSFYDGASSVTAPPTRGILTRRRQWDTTSSYIDTVSTPDAAGRIAQVVNPRGYATATAFASFHGYPQTVTNQLGHTTTTVIDVGLGTPLTVTDANNKTTTLGYDALGRLVSVKRYGDTQPTIIYEYSVTKTSPPSVKTTVVHDTGIAPSWWQFYDGLGRLREQQRNSPTLVGRIVAVTDYDTKGLVVRQSDEFYDSSTGPGANVLTAATYGTPPRETRTSYGILALPTRTARWASGVEQWHTDFYYDGWLSSSTPPAGGATQTEVDAYGRTIKRTDYGNSSGVGTYAWVTSYTYTARGEMASTTDPKNNLTSATYDLLGRVTSRVDPDRGTTSYGYDANGNMTSMSPALAGYTETYLYDELDRPTATWVGGFKRREHLYDAAGERGLRDRSIEYDYTGGTTAYPYVVDVAGYDSRNRPTGTTYTIPVHPGITDGLNGNYTFTQTYNSADQPKSTVYPAMGDLSIAETVNRTYLSTGEPNQLAGWEWYVKDSAYNYDGTPAATIFGPPNADGSASPFQIVRGVEWDSASGRLGRLTATRRSGQIFQADRYYQDTVGNITAISHNPDGTASDHTECFGYDPANRLTQAFTTSVLDNCAGGYNGAGPNPINESYTVDEIGNLTSGPAGSYTYNPSGAGSTRPHAPTQVGATTLGYDAAGRRTSATTAGIATTYNWNVPGDRLASIDRGGTRVATMVYGADGIRLLRKSATETTLYLGGLAELTRTTSGTVTATRYYTHNGATIAVRSYSQLRFIIGNQQGSTVSTASAYTADIDYQQYLPYGAKRGGDTLTTTQHGFLAQTEDDAAGLAYLNNRYHDPMLGVFISVDPLVDMTGEPYIYASGNPTTLSDPTGLCSVVAGEFYCGGTNFGDYDNGDADYNLHNGAVAREVEKMRNEDSGPSLVSVVKEMGPTLIPGYDCYHLATTPGNQYGSAVGCGLDIGTLGVASRAKILTGPGDELAEGGARWWDELFEGTRAACSFFGDTPVLMADGTTEPIADVDLGDMVMAFDPETGEGGPREVTHLWVHADSMLELDLGGGSVTTTEDHPFWNATDQAWEQAQQLDAGDRVLTADGELVEVGGLDWSTTFTGTAYNFTVDDIHTYFIAAGDHEILVHNTCLPGPGDIPTKVVNTNMPHAAGQAVGRAGFETASDARTALRELSESIRLNGFPAGTIADTRPGRVLVPFGSGGYAVYQVQSNGNAVLKTVLTASP